MSKPRVVFMGTPSFAVPALHAVAAACEVVSVVTRPDRPRGRGRHTAASEVATAAEELGLPLLKCADMRAAEVRERLAALAPDLFAVVAFGAILDSALLRVPRLGCINLHGSLLPDYRGASPVQRALWDGRPFTGVTTLWMDEGIDTGDCVLQRWAAIHEDDDLASLAARLASLGAPLLAESLVLAHAGHAPRRPQARDAGSYARKLRKEDGVIDWSLDAASVWNRARAVTPWPGAQTAHHGRRLRIVAARPLHLMQDAGAPGVVVEIGAEGIVVACRPGALRITRVQPEARSEMRADEWARGARVAAGDVLAIEKEAHA